MNPFVNSVKLGEVLQEGNVLLILQVAVRERLKMKNKSYQAHAPSLK